MVCLFIVQSFFIQRNTVLQHRKLGVLGVGIAVGITVTLIPAGLYQVEKELSQGFGQTAISSIVGTITSAALFISLVLAAILRKETPSTHKRLMLLATIVLLWPAWFRFRHLFPAVPNPEIWFALVLADSLIVVSIVWDRITQGRFNPILLSVGIFIIAEHSMEAYFFYNALWRELAAAIYKFLT